MKDMNLGKVHNTFSKTINLGMSLGYSLNLVFI
jgi:hypothetical protein